MARTELERSVQPSLIDRLTDLEPRRPSDPSLSRDESERLYRASVQRDLEWLLNTRRSIVMVDKDQVEVSRSVHEYGVVDTTGRAVATVEGRNRLTDDVRDAIARFEPRLTNVRVVMRQADQVSSPQIRFVIEATLRMDPNPEQVLFDTVLEVSIGVYAIEGETSHTER
jgi:type VI secretion system protein ImpF